MKSFLLAARRLSPCVFLLMSLVMTLRVTAAQASPIEQAEMQAKSTFDWPESKLSASDQVLVDQPWAKAPFDTAPFTYTFAEMQQKWPQLMRGLKIDFPSPEYLKARYLKFPGLLQSLEYQDADWQQHSYNVLEVWQSFFRGDFQHAYQLGNEYGGYAQVPGVLSEIIEAVYLTPTMSQKQALLRDAILRICRYGEQFPYVAGDKNYSDDYAMLRLGFAYAVGRMAEDEPVSLSLTKHAVSAMNAANELLAQMPEHPMGLALAGGVDANVIRRVGKLIGSVGLDVHSFDADKAFQQAIKLVPDMAILRYEYANSMLYTQGRAGWSAAQAQLQAAVATQPMDVMEALDIAYAKKHLAQLDAWVAGSQTYESFDAEQRKQRVAHDINGYSVLPVQNDVVDK